MSVNLVLLDVYTVKPRKFELRFLEILPNSKSIWDTLDSENMLDSRSISIAVYNNVSFGRAKELSQSGVSFTHPNSMFDRKKPKQ